MGDAFIVDAWRTPFCRAGGALAAVSPQALVESVLSAVHTRLPPLPNISDVLMGNVLNGRGNLARYGLLGAGFATEIPGSTVDRQCASGMDAIAQAYYRCQNGRDARSFIAGGIESMSQAPFLMARSARAYDRNPPAFLNVPLSPPNIGDPTMIETAETVAAEADIDRERMDKFAFESHMRAISAQQAGRLAGEINPVLIATQFSDQQLVSADVGPRSDTSLAQLAQLSPVIAGGTVTAGNASGIADGAACVVVLNEVAVKQIGLKPLARIVAVSCVGVEPKRMGLGPVSAINRLLDEQDIVSSQVVEWEINEAFAGQLLACTKVLELDPTGVNRDGGAIALGHPLGASGARIVGHLAHSLSRLGQSGALGIAALCVGGGMGMAMLLESA